MRSLNAPMTTKKATKATKKPNGYVLHEADDYVVIATGFATKSNNPKTGDMVQVWILPRHVNPVEAVKTGQNRIVCMDCKHAGTNGKGVTCYVRVPNAPLAIWRGYQRGIYPVLDLKRWDHACEFYGKIENRKVRFGAYGEPVLIPFDILAAISRMCAGWTGYTHQWANPEFSQYREFLMASVDSTNEFHAAKMAGWRTFRVRSESAGLQIGEIVCPASDEGGKRTDCATCRLCNGASGPGDGRKDIAIIVHGSGKAKFELISIAGLA